MIGHWVEQALQARQPDIASFTSCEKSYSPLPAYQLLRVFSINVRKLRRCCGSCCSSTSGSTPCSDSRRSHSRTSAARPFGEWMRLPVIFIDGHIGLRTSKLKHRPLPLHSIAPRNEVRTSTGMRRSRVPRLTASTFIIGASTPSGEQILPGLRRLFGSKAALMRRSSRYSCSPKNSGLYSARKPLPCSPHSKPPYLAVSATTRSESCFISTSCWGSHMSSAGRTCSTPAST
ncbi:hypothetical protein D3C80_1130120 [compost metagenome]